MLKQAAVTGLVAWATLASAGALADGMPRASLKDTPSVVPIWSGIYVGAGVGYGHLAAENNYSEPGFASSWKGEGGAGGLGIAVLGYDRQVRDRYVLGVFGEYEWSSIELTYQDTNTPEQKFRLRDAFSAGGRAGFLLTPTSLLYLSAGYTWARGKSDQYFDIASGGVTFPGKTSLDFGGPFIGVGMETHLGHRLTLRGEVRYTMFGEEITNQDANIPFTDTFTPDLLTGRLVLTYRFDRDDHYVGPLK